MWFNVASKRGPCGGGPFLTEKQNTMIKIILITGFSLVAFLITILTMVAIDQQRQIKRGTKLLKQN